MKQIPAGVATIAAGIGLRFHFTAEAVSVAPMQSQENPSVKLHLHTL